MAEEFSWQDRRDFNSALERIKTLQLIVGLLVVAIFVLAFFTFDVSDDSGSDACGPDHTHNASVGGLSGNSTGTVDRWTC